MYLTRQWYSGEVCCEHAAQAVQVLLQGHVVVPLLYGIYLQLVYRLLHLLDVLAQDGILLLKFSVLLP